MFECVRCGFSTSEDVCIFPFATIDLTLCEYCKNQLKDILYNFISQLPVRLDCGRCEKYQEHKNIDTRYLMGS